MLAVRVASITGSWPSSRASTSTSPTVGWRVVEYLVQPGEREGLDECELDLGGGLLRADHTKNRYRDTGGDGHLAGADQWEAVAPDGVRLPWCRVNAH